jgi:LuxR family maltose regulon positive regulatory protein
MDMPLLATKLFIPQPRPRLVSRPRLIEQLNGGLAKGYKLTLISASAGFGKTTLVSEWVIGCDQKVAWLSLDEGDNNPARFLTYFVAALQTIDANFCTGILNVLQTPQPPPIEPILTALVNEITVLPDNFIFVLDDYHIIDSKQVDKILTFLLEHLPPRMHLVIATREDPHLPLARLRAKGQLTELRVADLRFTSAEAADFLNQVMGLNLIVEDITALETRTEGWIAGLQLAALSLQGHQDTTDFIKSFTGSHRFVLDYLMEEVLQQQSESIQAFLLHTSILDRMCGQLCDAVLSDSSVSGQETLEYLDHANLFIVPLDNERRWYRYHHLFRDLLRQRLIQSGLSGNEKEGIAIYHIRASQWYEEVGLVFEAFQHAAAANDVERAERLIEGDEIPRHFRNVVTTILDWLKSLPITTLNARPVLWWRYATFLMFDGQTTGVDEKLIAAENALQGAEEDDKTRNLIGQIAGTKAMLALTRYQVENLLIQSRRALDYLDPENLSSRASANLTLGFAYFLQGDRSAARQSYLESLRLCQECGNTFVAIMATNGLGNVLEIENALHQAAETYQNALRLFGDQPLHTHAGQASIGLARIFYEWNDLDTAEQYGKQSLQQVLQYDAVIDRFVISEVFLARLKLAQGDIRGAAASLAQTEQSARQRNFIHRLPEIAEIQISILITQGQVAAAVKLAQQYELPLSQARVALAQGNPSATLVTLESYRQKMEAKGWADKLLKVMILQAVALHAIGEIDEAVKVLGEVLVMAEPGGFVRLFIDEGAPMAHLLLETASRGFMPEYIDKLLAAFEAERQRCGNKFDLPIAQSLVEPLSSREIEVLQLISRGLSNREIGERLFLAISTVKGHNQIIFDKLQVKSRTEAVARARELDLL